MEPVVPPHPLSYREQLRSFLREDWGTQDWSTAAVPDRPMRGRILAKSGLVLAGLPMAIEVFRMVDPNLDMRPRVRDGDWMSPGDLALEIEGSSRAILQAERVALNLLQRLSGTATLARAFSDAVAGTRARILDTRKTTPGLKLLEKYAVRCGGAFNHRHTLGDGVLLKENHLAAAGGIRPAVQRVRAGAAPSLLRVEVEVQTLDQLREALDCPDVDGALLDHMDVETLRESVVVREAMGSRAFLEASGNVTLERVRAIAETGVDYISVGALTHSAPAADLSLLMG
ncbi:MAG: carboxylating nicotinate-nucleotide diphosphorylase [Acidobacteria bacterium]|nr:carboxylating nicotinate-nucleotide diphosphorylase [Acidobacteriota bacterium]